MWSGECEVRSVKCEAWSVWSVERGVRSAEWRVWSGVEWSGV